MLARARSRAPTACASSTSRTATRPALSSAPVRSIGLKSRNPFNFFSHPHKWLSAPDTPSPKEQYKYSSYHKYGVLRDDFYVTEVPAIKEAVRRLPKKVKEGRDMRLKRASDLVIKKQFLPENQWTTPYEDVPYLDEYLTEVNKEAAMRKSFRADSPVLPYQEYQGHIAAHFQALHKLRHSDQ